MKLRHKLLYSIFTASTLLASCTKDVLDRPPLDSIVDDYYWRNETDVRLFANGFYTQYFVGYNSAWGVDYAPVRGYTFSDDLTSKNVQTNFENAVPASRASNNEDALWLTQYAGPTWDFAWVRKSNIFIDRLQDNMQATLTPEAFNHWMAVARFFRGFEYSRLVSVFGDVPYFDHELAGDDFDEMYKDRDNRGVVMDHVYDDFKFALENMRINDGKQVLNRYVAAAFISRFMLFEGTFQHYHGLDGERARKYLELAVEASEIVMNSGQFNFSSDFKSLFSSESLDGNKEVILWRTYDATLGVTHHIGSYQNGTETMGVDGNLVLIKSFLCNDGQVWQNSGVANAADFSLANLAKTRDPRFEASFMDVINTASASMMYGYKFASREAITYIGKSYPPAWGGNTNTSDAPVIRLAEVVLDWIEAKAVLAEFMGGAALTQDDLDRSINAIRDRPLDATAIAKGVQKTAHLELGRLPNDPSRNADVSPLIWEIRRERRMEFVFEHTRLLDLKRWKKIQYMNFDSNPDYYAGPWVNFPVEAAGLLKPTSAGQIQVRKANGSIVTYDGSNNADMVGFYLVPGAKNRNTFGDEVYMAPIGDAQIVQYKDKGYTLTQTVNW